MFAKQGQRRTVHSNNIYLNSFTCFIHTKHRKRSNLNLSGPLYLVEIQITSTKLGIKMAIIKVLNYKSA